jgi:hypothetical protein
MPGAASATGQHARIHAARDQYMLRPLPGEDLYSHFKKIDNSRLVREPDPQARGACWSAIGATALGVMLLTGVLAPRVANTLAGYKLEARRWICRRPNSRPPNACRSSLGAATWWCPIPARWSPSMRYHPAPAILRSP